MYICFEPKAATTVCFLFEGKHSMVCKECHFYCHNDEYPCDSSDIHASPAFDSNGKCMVSTIGSHSHFHDFEDNFPLLV